MFVTPSFSPELFEKNPFLKMEHLYIHNVIGCKIEEVKYPFPWKNVLENKPWWLKVWHFFVSPGITEEACKFFVMFLVIQGGFTDCSTGFT